MTRPDWVLRRATPAFDRRGDEVDCGVHELRRARRESDTWCGSNSGRRLRRAGWRRFRRGRDLRSAARAADRGRLDARRGPARAEVGALRALPPADGLGGRGGDAGWPATAPAPRNWPRRPAPGLRAITASIRAPRRSRSGVPARPRLFFELR